MALIIIVLIETSILILQIYFLKAHNIILIFIKINANLKLFLIHLNLS